MAFGKVFVVEYLVEQTGGSSRLFTVGFFLIFVPAIPPEGPKLSAADFQVASYRLLSLLVDSITITDESITPTK